MKSNRALCCILFISTWWALAFHYGEGQSPLPLNAPLETSCLNSPGPIGPLDRKELLQALSGDRDLMKELILRWDLEAQLLEKRGLKGIKRLSPEELYAVCRFAPEEKQTPLSLPQTYTAASLLFALAEPESIAAVPEGMRSLPELYPEEILKNIPLNAGRSQGELLFSKRPEIAFVAPYSNPACLETLKRQGIKLLMLPSIDSLESLFEAVEQVGQAIGKPRTAALLNTFIKASIQTIDNRALLLPEKEGFLYLTYRAFFSAPTQKQLTGQFLERLGLNRALKELRESREWTLPIPLERIHQIGPAGLIISSTHALPRLPAGTRVSLVSPTVQQAASQYSVIAYLDLFEALKELSHAP